MGASNSKPTVIQNETAIQFSPQVVEQLSNGPQTTPPERQSTLDTHIRARIKSELEHLRHEEESVRQKIHDALEKENLDRERAMAADEDGHVKTSAALLGDLDEIQAKIVRIKANQHLPSVKLEQEALIACYRSHSKSTLDCWKEVENFKASVAKVEQESPIKFHVCPFNCPQEYLKSLQ